MRIGIFGGTFDPIHYGHLLLAEQCREQQRLDEVWFVPAAQPPHKLQVEISSARSRCEMIQFAIAGSPAFRLNKVELERSGVSYTVSTLEQLKSEDPTRELFLLIGADSLRDLAHWRDPSRILELSTVVAVNRGGFQSCDRSELRAICGQLADERVVEMTMPAITISASDIRQRIATDRSIRFLVPRAVETYIREHGLYRNSFVKTVAMTSNSQSSVT